MRSAITLVVAYLLLILQSTVLELAPVRMAAPSLGPAGGPARRACRPSGRSRRRPWSSFATGYLLDLVSGAPQGVHAFVFVLMVLFARALSVRVAVTGIVLSAATSFVASLLAALLIVLVRAQVAPEGGYGGLRQAPLEALLTGVLRAPSSWACCAASTARSTRPAHASASSRGPRTLSDGLHLPR